MAKDIMNIVVLTPYVEGFYFGGFVKGIQSVAKSEGVRLIVIQTSITKFPSDTPKYDYPLAFNYADGWIILPQSVNEKFLNSMCNLGKPIVMLTGEIRNDYCRYVLPDEYECVRSATKHLIEHGHKKIAFAGCFALCGIDTRFCAYQDALKEYNIPFDQNLVFNSSDSMRTGGYEAAEKMLNLGVQFSGLIACSDYMALGIIDKLKESGHKIPEDIALISFDDTEYAKTSVPPLSSIQQNVLGMGSTAAKTLIDYLKGRSSSLENVTVRSDIILRSSCGCKDTETCESPELADKNNNNPKVIKFLENVILNDSNIGYNLINADLKDIKNLSWLTFTDFHSGYLGLWDKQVKNLIIEQFYDSNRSKQLDSALQCPIEDFPLQQLLTDSTYPDDVVWLHPIFTETQEYGVLTLIGPIMDIKLLSNFDTMTHCFDLLAFALEREALSQNRNRNLLDNIGQGFLTLDRDLFVENEYNSECRKIFGHEISGEYFPDLVLSEHKEQKKFLEDLLSDLIKEKDGKRSKLFMGLLPNEFMIQQKNILVDYRLMDDLNEKEYKKILIVLTDISDRRKLESKAEYERNVLKMVVKAVLNRNEMIGVINDYIYFCENTLLSLLNSSRLLSEIILIVFRYVHTFRGNFSQMDTVNIVKYLNDLENELSKIRDKMGEMTCEQFCSLMKNKNIKEWLTEDLDILKKYLGESYFNVENIVITNDKKIDEIEKSASPILSNIKYDLVCGGLQRLKFKSLNELLKFPAECTYKLAEKLGISINPIEVAGKNILVDRDKYFKLIKLLAHIFRNAVEHGIEPKDERIQRGKDEKSTIRCEAQHKDGSICFAVSDDGRGINFEKVRQRLVEKGVCDTTVAAGLSKDQLMEYLFTDKFTAGESIADFPVRGMGLAVVKKEVESLGGEIKVDTEEGKGTTFRFMLPYQDIFNNAEVSRNSLLIPIVEKVKEFFMESYGYTLHECAEVRREADKKVILNDFTSMIDIKGMIHGRMLITADCKMVESLTGNFLLGDLNLETESEYMEDVLAECTNIILGNSMELLEDIGGYIIWGTPTTIRSKGGFIMCRNSEVWTCNMKFEQGELTLCFVASSEKKHSRT